MKTLASDAFEGRAPGTPGETKTIAWLIAQFKALKAATRRPERQLDAGRAAGPHPAGRRAPCRAGDTALVAGPRRLCQHRPRRSTASRSPNAPLVFVGYGVTAPERGWDDFKGVDLKGKVAVFLVNDPDFEAVAGDDARASSAAAG